MKLIYMMGKSSSGKDTIYKSITNTQGLNTYVSYTTRPKRHGEVDGETYNFLTQEEMQEYIDGKKNGNVIEYRIYNTVYGPWIYATIDDEQFKSEEDIITIGTLESYTKLKNYFKNDEKVELLPVYVEVPDNIRLRRAIEREERGKGQYEELCRRFITDSKDFSEDKLKAAGITKRFQNIELKKCIQEIQEYIGITHQKVKEQER